MRMPVRVRFSPTLRDAVLHALGFALPDANPCRATLRQGGHDRDAQAESNAHRTLAPRSHVGGRLTDAHQSLRHARPRDVFGQHLEYKILLEF